MTISFISRWTGGDWLMVGVEGGPDGLIKRGDCNGWRTNDGIMVWGGWGPETEEDLSNVLLIDNDYNNAGK